jgi:hypothetical protein
MNEPKGVFVDTWPVLIDRGVWSGSGLRPWRSDPVPHDSTVQYEMEMTLRRFGVRRGHVLMSHSTSWRDGTDGLTAVYIAVINPNLMSVADFPDAIPVDVGIREVAGVPPTHGPADAPAVRKIDPLIHSLRHVWALIDPDPANKFFDATIAAALGLEWVQQLGALDPALAGLYGEAHSAA